MEAYFKSIEGSEKWCEIKPINKGWSEDRKYYAKDDGGKEYLVRVFPYQNDYEKREEAFRDLQLFNRLSINIPKVLSFGRLNENELFSVFSWVRGYDLEEKIRELTEKEQYSLGIEAGKILKEIHSINVSVPMEPWEIKMNYKIDRKIKGYKECGIKISGEEKIISYINENRHLLKGRPESLQHGDYHIGNMVLSKDRALGIIDLNRVSYGDPWSEFDRIVWCADISPYFASGRINGYFDGTPPEAFFRLMALYICSNQLSSIPWAISFGDKEIKTMIRQGENIMNWYEGFERFIPKWYIKESK